MGTYGYAHPHAGNYDILTARGFDHRGPSCWVALIVYLSPASNSAWKLLFKSERHDSMIQAMEQVLHRLQDDANVMLVSTSWFGDLWRCGEADDG